MTTTDAIRPAHRRLWSGLASDDVSSEIGVLGVPFDGATSFRKGASFAPSKIRELSPHIAPYMEEGIGLAGLRVRDYGDVFVDLDWERYFKTVEARAQQTLRHRLAIFLGGDHSVTIPLTRAFSQSINGKFGMLHIDAHLDLADSFEGSRWSHACTQRRVLELPNIDPRNIAFVGIRSFMEDEMEFMHAHPQIGLHTAREVYMSGVNEVARSVIEQMQGVDALYVTLDIDALDPAYAPGTGTPEAGGLSTRDVLELLRRVFSDLPVHAFDIVEVSPPLDHADITSVAALKVIYEAFGSVKAKSSEKAQ